MREKHSYLVNLAEANHLVIMHCEDRCAFGVSKEDALDRLAKQRVFKSSNLVNGARVLTFRVGLNLPEFSIDNWLSKAGTEALVVINIKSSKDVEIRVKDSTCSWEHLDDAEFFIGTIMESNLNEAIEHFDEFVDTVDTYDIMTYVIDALAQEYCSGYVCG